MSFWRFRAYDGQMVMIDGVIASPSFNHLALILRQKGLQVVSAVSIPQSEYQAELRLQKMKLKLHPPEAKPSDSPTAKPDDQQNESSIRRFVDRVISLFRWW